MDVLVLCECCVVSGVYYPPWNQKYTAPPCRYTSRPGNVKGHGQVSEHSACKVIGGSSTWLWLGLSVVILASNYSLTCG